MSDTIGIIKKILHTGYRYVPITDGCKVHFHFQTWKLGKYTKTLIDDSREIAKKEPMVLIIGHKFKLDVWENVIKLMAVGEVASFRVKKELVFSYPFIAKTLRELDRPPSLVKHTCSMSLHQDGLGYDDLDSLINYPCDLEFIFELIKVEKEDEYEKDVWQLSEQERIEKIPELRERGNELFNEKRYNEAEERYKQALGILEQLMVKERKGDDEWVKMNNIKLPLLLNYCQCKLMKEEYYPVIEHCSYILQYDKNNEKALYRRGKAHIAVWNPEEAEADFIQLKCIRPSLTASVNKQLGLIAQMRKQKQEQDREVLKRLFAHSEKMKLNEAKE